MNPPCPNGPTTLLTALEARSLTSGGPPAGPHPGRIRRAGSLWARAALVLASATGLLAGCGETLPSEDANRGLQALDVGEYIAAEHHGHDHAEGDDHKVLRRGFHDFASIPDGEVVRHTFRLSNTDRVPLTLQQIEASCTCSIPRVSYVDEATGERIDGHPSRSGDILTVPAGAEVSLEVVVDTRNVRVKNVDKLVTLRVTTDSVHQPYTMLEMHMIVSRPFDPYPTDNLDLGLVPVSGGAVGSLQLTQAGATGARLTEVLESSHEGLLGSVVFDFGQARSIWHLEAALDPGEPLGLFRGWLRLGSVLPDGEPGPEMDVRVHGRIVEDVHVPQGRLILRGSPLTAVADIEAVDPSLRIVLEEPELRGDHAELLRVRAEPSATDTDGAVADDGATGASRTWRVTLELAEGAELPAEVLKGVVVVRSNNPIQIEKEIPYVYVPR